MARKGHIFEKESIHASLHMSHAEELSRRPKHQGAERSHGARTEARVEAGSPGYNRLESSGSRDSFPTSVVQPSVSLSSLWF